MLDPSEESTPAGRILGLDPGTRRVGVAISDPGRVIATPLEVIDRRRTGVMERVLQLCRDHEVTLIVVGMPTSLSGEAGPAAALARELGEGIATSTGCDVVYWDERFTSVTAEAALLESGMRRRDRRHRRDMVAAAVILQGYLDHQRSRA
jgi:putative Holliday junction resolvase